MSASRIPTLAPSADSASARFTATVDLPTPPLPEATAMMFFTPSMGFTPFCTPCAAMLNETLTVASLTPAMADTFSFSLEARAATYPLAGQPRTTSTVTLPLGNVRHEAHSRFGLSGGAHATPPTKKSHDRGGIKT